MMSSEIISLHEPDVFGDEVFIIPPEEVELYRKRGLLGQSILELANNLADLDADQSNLSDDEWEAISNILSAYRSQLWNHPTRLYSRLLTEHSPDAINTNLWVNFAKDRHYPFNVSTIGDMPTEILEKNCPELWQRCFDAAPPAVKKAIMIQLKRRTDYYGAESMPTEMAFGILFNEEEG